MDSKPLLPRFALLFFILGIGALALWTKPIKKGMDLEGGHSLIFRAETEGDKYLLTQTIDILKERVDPQGVMNLEWRPVGDDRFEVRMPIGSRRARDKQLEFVAALDKLTRRNVDPAFLRRLITAPAEQRDAMIVEKLGPESPRAVMLLEAAGLHDKVAAEQTKIADALAKLQTRMEALRSATPPDRKAIDALQAEIDKLTGPRDLARGRYYDLVADVYRANIRTSDLRSILKLFDPPRVAAQLKQETAEKRKTELAEGLAAYAERYPDVADEIAQVAELYKSWAKQRGPLDDPEDLIRLIRRAGVLEFRIAPMRNQVTEFSEYFEQIQDPSRGPSFSRDRDMDYQWFPVREGEQLGHLISAPFAGQTYVLLSNRTGDTMLQRRDSRPWKLESALPSNDQSGRRSISFRLDARGGELFGELTGNHLQEPLAILLDDEVYSAPNINSVITTSGEITGSYTPTEQRDLVKTLNSGSIRARVNPNPVAVNSIGPTLGQENIRRGLQAAVYGMICVVIFMAIYYMVAGLIANAALAINVFLILAAMAAFDVVFTLPGIAGLILTMGIAVDANVLIFERLREERRNEPDMIKAMNNAYAKALSAILDGNLTTVLVCLILWWVGTQEIKGFAMTLGLGIGISLFTALLVTRWIFRLLRPAQWNTHMLQVVGTPKVDWFSKRKIFWVLSAALIIAGLYGVFSRGRMLLGIEFSSGSRAVIRLNDEALVQGGLMNDARVEDLLKQAGQAMDVATMSGQNVQVNELKTPDRVEVFLAAYDAAANGGNADGMISRGEWQAQDRDASAFDAYLQLMDDDGDGQLDSDELVAHLPETRYQITTAESDHEKVRGVIDAAYEGMLSSMTAVDFTILRDQSLEGMGIALNAEGYAQIPEEFVEGDGVGGDFRDYFEINAGGVLMAFRLDTPAEALTPAEVQARLRSTRLQAGREQTYVVHTTVLPLTPAEGRPNRFTAFAVISGSADVPPRGQDAELWQRFADSEVDLLGDALGTRRSLESLTNFDAAMTVQATQLAIVAVLLSWISIIVYLWVRFGSIQWGLAAVICLVHDTLVVVGLVALCGLLADTGLGKTLMLDAFKVDMTVIAAILTVIGYSVNDTIVVFDRIRENRKKSLRVTPSILNRSINQTLARTLLTSTTTLIVVVVMYIWGGDGIHGFSFTLLAGILFGTYSSIAIASPLLLGFKQALVSRVTASEAADDAVEIQ